MEKNKNAKKTEVKKKISKLRKKVEEMILDTQKNSLQLEAAK